MAASDTLCPHWQASEALQLPAVERDWLFNQASLTQRLSTLSQQRFSVRLLEQGWQVLRTEECAALGIAPGSLGWVREVYLCGAEQPWVFARSVAAQAALVADGLDLSQLGTRSLGELLFQDQAFTRGPLLACQYPWQWLPKAFEQQQLWARRSRFSRDQVAVLVCEVFLPAFWQAVAA